MEGSVRGADADDSRNYLIRVENFSSRYSVTVGGSAPIN